MILVGIADRLLLASTTLTLLQLAVLFDVSVRTLERWMAELGFPVPICHKPGERREWLPAKVRAWVLERIRLEESSWDIAQVCAYTGRSRSYWQRKVKAGEAPKPIARALGSGKDLWAIEDVKQWLADRSEGLPAGHGRAGSSLARPKVLKRMRCESTSERRGPKRSPRKALEIRNPQDYSS